VLRKISKKLKAMKIYSKEKNWKELSETYAELGKEALTNQFSFQTFLDLLGKKNYSFDFKVSGEKIKTIHINEFKEDIPLDLGLNY
jgi:hypothetical protein